MQYAGRIQAQWVSYRELAERYEYENARLCALGKPHDIRKVVIGPDGMPCVEISACPKHSEEVQEGEG